MIIKSKLLKRGFSTNLFEDASIEYIEGIWETIGRRIKEAVVENLVYLKVSPYTMFNNEIFDFDFSKPHFKELSDKSVLGDIPRISEEDKVNVDELVKKFNNKNIKFKDDNVKVIDNIDVNESCLIGMSFGKDSLLSYGIADEIGLKPKLVMVQDFWDKEAEHKFDLLDKFEEEFDLDVNTIYDSLDDMSAYKRINKTSSEGIVGANAMNSYIMMLMPFAVKYGSSRIIFGNEQNFNDYYLKDNLRVYPSYEQSSEWMTHQNKALSAFTNNKVKVNSFIEPIYNIAEVKVLFNRYPQVAKYQMSCSLGNTRKRRERWCYNCPMCAKAFLYLKANNVDPKLVKFNFDFFNKECLKFYPLFNSDPERIYEKPKEVRDEQLFAFYLVFRNKATGYLIDKFKNEFLDEAKQREDELYKKFFGVHNSESISGSVKQKVESIFKEELE